jgi:hypothetical protein
MESLSVTERAALDIAGADYPSGSVELLLDDEGLLRLREAGLSFEILESRSGGLVSEAGDGRAPTDPLLETDYLNPLEMEQFLQQTLLDHPQITRLEQIGTSVAGRPIWALLISDNAALDENEPTLMFNAATHGREVMTPEVIVDMIDWLTDRYATDPTIAARVDATQIWLVPMVNPDGVDLVFQADRWWRKNASDYDDNGRITWKDGVDLNRNYEWGWGNECLGSSDVNSDATYRGVAEVSEPEVATMIEFGRRIRPVIYVEYHSWGEDVFYALGCDPSLAPQLTTIQDPNQQISRVIAEEYAALLTQADGEVGFVASSFGNRVNGIGRDQHAHDSGSISFVTELNGPNEGFQPSYAAWRDATVEGQRVGWLWLIDRVAGAAVGGNVIDAESGAAIAADLSLDELVIRDGRRLATNPQNGLFHLLVVPGQYTLRLSATGYDPVVQTVVVGSSWQPLTIQMSPDRSELIMVNDFEDVNSITEWTVGDPDDDAVEGLWEYGDPYGVLSGDLISGTLLRATPNLDRSAGLGRFAFLTGNAAGASLGEGDVDGGATSLISPAFDTSDFFGITIRWQQWFSKDASDPQDRLALDLSLDDGVSWQTLFEQLDSTLDENGERGWEQSTLQLDPSFPLGSTRLRFRAVDVGSDHLVEAMVDDLVVRGRRFSETQIDSLTWSSELQLDWSLIPGAEAAEYEIVRGDVAALTSSGGEVEMGALSCIALSSVGNWTLATTSEPTSGGTDFYLVRLRLPNGASSWGQASDGSPRAVGNVCP